MKLNAALFTSIFLLTYLLGACIAFNQQTESATSTEQTSVSSLSSSREEHNMDADIQTGSIPKELDLRLKRRDTQPLPPGALLKFQLINRGKEPVVNYRWILYEDGRWFFARHSGADSDWQTPFDTELPKSPTQQLPANVVNEVRKNLQSADFLNQPPYQIDRGVRDGGYRIVTARIDGNVHEVIYVAVNSPLLDSLEKIVTTYE
jgi:hypothetical protein